MTTSTTTNYGHPYPEDDEYVIGGDDAIEALAKHLDAVHAYDHSVTLDSGESAKSAGAGVAIAVDFPGTDRGVYGFATDRETFNYQGGGHRMFLVSAHVEVEVASAGSAVMRSTAYLFHDGLEVCSSSEETATTDATLTRHKVVHHLVAPVFLANGGTVNVTANGTGGAVALGLTSIRIYPVGGRAL